MAKLDPNSVEEHMFPVWRPQINVLTKECLEVDLATAQTKMHSISTVKTWVLDNDTLAFEDAAYPLVRHGGLVERNVGVVPSNLLLNEVEISETFPMFGSIPSSRFFVAFVFPKSEEPCRVTSISRAQMPSPLSLKLHTYKDLGAERFLRVERIFAEWFEEATTTGFHGEIIVCPRHSINPYSAPPDFPYPQQFGLVIEMPVINEVCFPWLELFLRLRRKLPKSMRVSLQFDNISSDSSEKPT
jgi:hypothetical protein